MVYIKWLNELSKDDRNIVGGKAANLGEMTKIGIPVPPRICNNNRWLLEICRI